MNIWIWVIVAAVAAYVLRKDIKEYLLGYRDDMREEAKVKRQAKGIRKKYKFAAMLKKAEQDGVNDVYKSNNPEKKQSFSPLLGDEPETTKKTKNKHDNEYSLPIFDVDDIKNTGFQIKAMGGDIYEKK